MIVAADWITGGLFAFNIGLAFGVVALVDRFVTWRRSR